MTDYFNQLGTDWEAEWKYTVDGTYYDANDNSKVFESEAGWSTGKAPFGTTQALYADPGRGLFDHAWEDGSSDGETFVDVRPNTILPGGNWWLRKHFSRGSVGRSHDLSVYYRTGPTWRIWYALQSAMISLWWNGIAVPNQPSGGGGIFLIENLPLFDDNVLTIHMGRWQSSTYPDGDGDPYFGMYFTASPYLPNADPSTTPVPGRARMADR